MPLFAGEGARLVAWLSAARQARGGALGGWGSAGTSAARRRTLVCSCERGEGQGRVSARKAFSK